MQQSVNTSSSLFSTNSSEMISSIAELITSNAELITSEAKLISSIVGSFILPIIIILIVLYIIFTEKGHRCFVRFLKSFKSIKMLGTEFVLSEKLNQEVGIGAEKAFELYRNQTKREYNRFVEIYGLRHKVENVIGSKRVIRALNDLGIKNITEIPGFRCTIHVPDILFRETLYQLTDYYPEGGGRGRTWSVRFGIIGRVWRSGKSESQGDILIDHNKLISSWGMTKEEALKFGQGRPSFACIVLKHNESNKANNGIQVGIFYMDSIEYKAFGNKDIKELCDAISIESKNCGLTSDLDKLRKELQNLSPLINIYG